MTTNTNTNTSCTKEIAWRDGKLAYDFNTMKFTLDKAGLFYFSATKGMSSTRAFLMAKGKSASLNEPGTLCTTNSWEAVDGMRWISFKGGDVDRKILVGFQAKDNKIYALVHNWPLKDKGPGKKWYTDDDMWHEPLDSTCVIASFDEPLSNRAGLMAKQNMNEVLKSSYVFFSKHFKTVDAYWRYAGGEDDPFHGSGPKMMVKIAMSFDSYINRQRRSIAKEFKGDHDGELIAVETLMATVEPTRMALEDCAQCYDLPLAQRVYYLNTQNDELFGESDAALEALTKQVECAFIFNPLQHCARLG